MTSRRTRGLAWAGLSTLGSAGFAVPWKLANELGDPSASVLMLLVSAALFNTLFLLGQRVLRSGARIRLGRIDLGVAAALALLTLLGNTASALAVQDLSPALLNVVLRVEVIFVAVLAWVLLGERVEGRYWLGASIAVLGLAVMQDIGGAGVGGVDPATLWALSAAACFSLMGVVTRRYIHRIDPVGVNSLRLWMAVALWFAFNPLPDLAAIPRAQAGYAMLAGLCGPFFARLLLMLSARHIEARLTALVNLTAPLPTLALGWWWLADWPETMQLLGGAIMILGVALPLLRRVR